MGLGIKKFLYRHKQQAVDFLPLFAPGSAGAGQLFELTMQSARSAFPLLVELMNQTGQQPMSCIAVKDFATASQPQAQVLGDLFERYGSDKTSHGYHPVYASIVGPDKTFRLVEIGMGTNNEDVPSNMTRVGTPGASLRAFRDYLPTASIVGADIDRRILFSEERIQTLWVDQTDAKSFEELASQAGDFDVLIDDGLHSPNANLGVLLFGLANMRTGAWTVIEDIVPAALPFWQVVDALLPARFARYIVQANTSLMFLVQRLH